MADNFFLGLSKISKASWHRAAIVALPLFAAYCSDSSGGNPAGPLGQDAGVSDSSSGGTDSGDTGDPVQILDTTAPLFDGAKTALAVGDTQINVTWSAAEDDTSDVSRIAYKIYIDKGKAPDFTKAYATTPAGAIATTLSGLDSGREYQIAVRAVDEAGNEDANVATVSAATPDFVRPVFGGVKSASATGPDSIHLEWQAATDNASSDVEMQYQVFVSDVQGQHDFTQPLKIVGGGATSTEISGLHDAQNYFVVVRAIDASGNADRNKKELSAFTLDGTAPVFTGAKSASVLGTAITLKWDAGTDNVDGAAYLKYNIYQATSPSGHDFTQPTYTAAPGATEFTAVGLNVSTTYYFIVRAVDSRGNEEANALEVSGTTAASPDVTPPSFGGLVSISALSATKLSLDWNAASDDYSQEADIIYDIYLATTPGAQAFATPTYTVVGQTHYLLDNVKPETLVYAVVRARDQVGNQEQNTKEASATTLADTTAPTFAGLQSVTAMGPTALTLSWNPATDDATPASKLIYRVYMAQSPGGQVFASAPLTTTAPGETQVQIGSLKPATKYYFVVRAVDEYSNADSNLVEVIGTTNPDTVAPTFAGAQSATAQSPTSLLVSWLPASDDVSDSGAIQYEIFWSETSGGQNFAAPSATTAAGATNVAISGLTPEKTYYVVVRARDAFGNSDTNTVQRSAATPKDTTAPVFAGATSVSDVTNTSLRVNWAAATDNVTTAGALKYRVCWSTVPGECLSAFTAKATVTGATSYALSSRPPNTAHYFVVRAEDAAANLDNNTVERTGSTTPDVTKPVFAGLASVGALGPTSLRLTWPGATDNVDGASAIVYDVYMATSSGAQNFAAASFTTAAGATNYEVTGLTPDTNYYFVVRARDTSGNRDTNTKQVSAATLPDTTAPMFAGAASVSVLSETSLRVNWLAASDDTVPAANLVYAVCWSTSATECSTTFSTKATTAAGATNYTLSGLLPATPYYFVVRTRDIYSNQDSNTVVKSGTTNADTQAPTFSGASSVSGASATTLTVNWSAASDNVTAAANIKYHICRTKTPSGCSGAAFTITTTVTGVTSHQYTALDPTTTYYFVVRAEDAYSNRDTNSTQVSGATVNDTTAPSFAGLSSATKGGATSIDLSWSAASDNVSTAGQIVYEICETTVNGGCNGAAFAADYITAAGATSYSSTGLTPNTTYYYVVRAKDQAGNRESNSTQRSATTDPDTTAPVFAGATSVSGQTATTLTVNWNAASDNSTQSSAIIYDICWSTASGGCQNAGFTVKHTSSAGAASAIVSGLSPLTPYYFVVRARDSYANRDNNNNQVSGTTAADTTAPTFAGATSVTNATVSSLRVNWSAASDNATASANMVYEVCWSQTPGSCLTTFSALATTAAGATNYTATSLTPSTAYYFVVRAVDEGGNFNSGNIERSGSTLADTSAPIFAGASSTSSATLTSLQVNWSAASDNTTSHASMDYIVCWSTSSIACTSGGGTSATVTGQLNYTVSNLIPGTTYYFLVRARDDYNNTDSNTNVISAAPTADSTAPSGGVASSVTRPSTTTLRVNFTQATDNYTAQGSIIYRVCMRTSAQLSTTCTSSFNSNYQYTVVGSPLSRDYPAVASGVRHYFVVRAEDQFGNRSTNTTEIVDDTTAPDFGSNRPVISQHSSDATRLVVSWSTSTLSESFWSSSYTRYRLCYSTSSIGCNDGSFVTHFTTGYGATSYTISGLSPRTLYYVWIRAEDYSGNDEVANHRSLVGATTLTSFSSNVQTIFNSCNGCHAWSYGSTVNQPSFYNAGGSCGGTLSYINPGDPQLSFIYRKMAVTNSTSAPFSASCPNTISGARMPYCSVAPCSYPSGNVDIMRDWIEQGALNN